MSNVRFLDNVSVSAFQGSVQTVTGANFPRFILDGETKVVPANTNIYAFDLYVVEGGQLTITEGSAVVVGGETLFTHGLLRVETTLTNEGTINNNGILEIGVLEEGS